MPSREPRSLGARLLTDYCNLRTPGPTGINDYADPSFWVRKGICRLLGDSPGPTGQNDRAEPTTTNSQAGQVVNPGTLAEVVSVRDFILRSVGRNGDNDFDDVCIVQRLLNRHRPTPLVPVPVNGVADEATIAAIDYFQKNTMKVKNPDGLVEPGKKTFIALSQDPNAPPPVKTKSGLYWVNWANVHAKNSNSVDDLASPFKDNVKEFIKALEDAGATVDVQATRRHAKRAYLFHWSWQIALERKKPSDATPMAGVPIEWDHGNDAQSKEGAQEMVEGFDLAVPPDSNVAPALNSNHIAGNAIDMDIIWTGTIKIKKKDGTEVDVPFRNNVNGNTALHSVGESYGVKKHTSDAPHWSTNGR